MASDVVVGLLWGALAGLALGAVFFLGLWATVLRVNSSRSSGALVAVSFVLRFALVAGGLYLVVRGGSWPLIGSLFGILAARVLVTRLVVNRGERRR